MKRILVTISITLSIIINITAQDKRNTFDQEWEKIETLDKDNLPKSAIEEVDKILKKSLADKNTPQVIKALLVKSKYEMQIDNDDNLDIFNELQDLIKQSDDKVVKALLHSLIAELYIEYFKTRSWEISRRTNLKGEIPEDILEWSTNNFADKTLENLNESIKNANILTKHTTKEYKDIIVLGKDSETYYPTMYDFIMNRAINLSQDLPKNYMEASNFRNNIGYDVMQLAIPADEFIKLNNIKNNPTLIYYQQYFKNLLSRDMMPTIILTELNKVDYLSTLFYSFKANDFEKELINKYKDNETVVVIIDDLVQKLITHASGNNSKDNITEAYNWCLKALNEYPDYTLINNIKSSLAIIEIPQLVFSGKSVYYPDNDVKINIEFKNLQSLDKFPSLNLYKVNNSDTLFVQRYELDYKSLTTYLTESTELNLEKLPIGNYILKVDNLTETESYPYSEKEREFNFVVSKLAAFSLNSAKDVYDVYVVNRMTGEPIEGAMVAIYENEEYKKVSTKIIAKAKTNKSGLASMKKVPDLNNNYHLNTYYVVTYGNDIYLQQNVQKKYYSINQLSKNNKPKTELGIFTDRSVYRPGQIVYFKVIAFDQTRKPLINRLLTVELKNTSNETISKKELYTNEFASVAGEFVLPQTGLLGQYSIQVSTNDEVRTVNINVEEYKRPSFEITFDNIEKTYTFGQEIKVKAYAKNFAGINLQDAKVTYTIKGNKLGFWRFNGEETFSQMGEIYTKEDGSFEIIFTPLAGETTTSLPFRKNSDIQRFTITANVTDLNNETQTGRMTMLVGEVSMLLSLELPDKIEKSQDLNVNIKAMNLNYVDIETTGEYKIYSLNEKDSIAEQVSNGTFRTGEQLELTAKIKKLESGKYRLCLTAKDNTDKDVFTETDFVIYSYQDKKPPVKTNEWLIEKNTKFSTDKNAEVIFGVSDKDVHVLYQLHNDEKVFENKWIKVSNENIKFSVPYKVEYDDVLYITLTYIKGEKYYNQNIRLEKDKEKLNAPLSLKMKVFRDKLRPGQEETWTLSVKDAKQNPVFAEVLASMYDSSLDKLGYYTSDWDIKMFYESTTSDYGWRYISGLNDYQKQFSPMLLMLLWKISDLNYNYYVFDQLDKFGFNFYGSLTGDYNNYILGQSTGGTAFAGKGKLRLAKSPLADDDTMSASEETKREYYEAIPPVPTNVQFTIPELEEDEGANLAMDKSVSVPQIRRNFNETAFFYPQLKTNEKGETQISFTVPESNTLWKFMVFAHDKESKQGSLEQLVKTRKELMVIPNMPRFVREGDKTNITAKISNLSENAIDGKVYIEFFDPISDKILDLNVINKEQNYTIAKEASTSANWTFEIPDGFDLLGCRIVAESGSFSDGEQHVISVLPNRVLITETLPFEAVKAGENTFVYEKFKNNKSRSVRNYRLTFEYTANPAWYAVQALPTLSNPTNNDVISWFASYYVNTLGASIVRQYPQISNVIKAWQKQGGDEKTLISKLQKDQELKNVLLSETPWVLEAKNETEQMQRLSLLFDLNNTTQEAEIATRKLADLQDRNGGWAWYKGMHPDRSMTQYILYGFAKLVYVGNVEYDAKIKEMQINALNFIDREIARDFENLKNNNKQWQDIQTISTDELEYLYVRTFYRDIPITQEAREAERFYTSVVSKNWQKLGLYECSLLVVTLYRNGEKELADKIAKSIREYAVTNEKTGMYWPNNGRGIGSSKMPVTYHTFLMDALQETGATVEEINLMKQWLVNQKQIQIWETTPATINAIGALLSLGDNWFETNKTVSSITVGNKNLMAEKAEIATGYIKKSWEHAEITKDMADVRIVKQDNKPSYGALYWQYYEDLDKITQDKTDLSIDKKMFKIEKTSVGNDNLVPITKDTPLKVGDKVTIRLIVRIDNNMEFVHIKDMRAPCFEPIETISGVKWQNNLNYYQEIRDASTNMFFEYLAKGTYIFEYQVYVNRKGVYSNGISTIQSIYAPEFVSHTKGEIITIK